MVDDPVKDVSKKNPLTWNLWTRELTKKIYDEEFDENHS